MEDKVAKAESEVLKLFEEKKTEVNILKKQIKVQTCETEGHVKEVNNHRKYIKERDMEIFKLRVKNENLKLNTKRLKYEISDIRDKNKMLMKEKKEKRT